MGASPFPPSLSILPPLILTPTFLSLPIHTDGSYSLTTLDTFADSLLHDERVCEIQLPRLTQRKVLEETEGLPARKSKLGKAMGVLGGGGGDESASDDEGEGGRERYMSRSPSRSPSPVVEGEDAKTPEYWTEGSEDESEEEGEKKEERKDREGSEGRYVSRSPSVGSARFVSRSPSPGSPKPVGMEVDN
ncbi:hypothetical protein P7C70_g9099, partial [Phenoliferia sp. Uapishka_3]